MFIELDFLFFVFGGLQKKLGLFRAHLALILRLGFGGGGGPLFRLRFVAVFASHVAG